MRGFPFVIIAVLFCLNALDGFDALAISFAAPGMTHEWGTSPQALGVSFPGGCSRPDSAHWGSLRWPIGSAGPDSRRSGDRNALLNHIFPANFDSKGLVLCSF